MHSRYIGVVGASRATAEDLEDARQVGRLLAEADAIMVCGGRGGVMEAASEGCAKAGGTVIGMLGGEDRCDANPWVTIAIPTGLGELRNGLIVRTADALIAVGGAYGTLSEIALGLSAQKVVYALHSWDIDGVVAVGSPAEAVSRAVA